jgi:hypothetical protein
MCSLVTKAIDKGHSMRKMQLVFTPYSSASMTSASAFSRRLAYALYIDVAASMQRVAHRQSLLRAAFKVKIHYQLHPRKQNWGQATPRELHRFAKIREIRWKRSESLRSVFGRECANSADEQLRYVNERSPARSRYLCRAGIWGKRVRYGPAEIK